MSKLSVYDGEIKKIVCNPTIGDNLQKLSKWVSAKGHYIEEGGDLYIEIADGLHDISTFLEITDGRVLHIRATNIPALLDINSAYITIDQDIYNITINLDSPLPDRVVPGFVVAGQNVQGNGCADLLNCAMKVKEIYSHRMSFTTEIRAHGVTCLDNFNNKDNTLTLGLLPNKLVVPFCTLKANEEGWDGSSIEGFLNAARGGKVFLKYIGISYNGENNSHNDMLFARDSGSEINLLDYVLIAGAGDMVCRTFNQGNIVTNRSFLGGDVTANNIFHGSAGGKASFTRTMMGNVKGDVVNASSDTAIQIANSILSSGNQLARTVSPDASIVITNTRLSRALYALATTKGNISIDSNSSIKHCIYPLSLAGGNIYGDPTFEDNTFSSPTPLEINDNGSVWIPTANRTYNPEFYKVNMKPVILDFPEIPKNSFKDLEVDIPKAEFNDFCLIQRQNSKEPQQGIDFRAFVSSSNKVIIRAYNITDIKINPTAFTARILVIRSTF